MSSTDDRGDLSSRLQIENLLDQLHAQTKSIGETWHAGQNARLRILAGQLAALAEGSGNQGICESTAEIEAVLHAEEAEASAVCERIEALILQCKKATGC